jgi:membrane associated rhomboid family serine protease
MGNPGSAGSRAGGSLPWLALLLASLFGVATLQAEAGSDQHAATARERLQVAEAYYEDHPYLEPGASLLGVRSAERLAELRAEWERKRGSRGGSEVLPRIARRQQAELDGMLAEATAALEQLPARRYGLHSSQWRPGSLFTHVFLHSGMWHLVGNVLLLLLLGVYLEPALGPIRTTCILLGGMLGAGLGFVFSVPGSDRVMIGSSGLLAGLLVVFAWDRRESRREGYYAVATIGGLVWLLLPPWIGIPWSLAYPGSELLGAAPSPRIVYGSYAGGAVGAGAVYALVSLLAGRREETAAIAHGARTSTGSLGLDEALKARAAGRDEAAFSLLTALLAREPEQLDAALLLADVSLSLGRKQKAEEAMLRAIRIEAKRNESGPAVRHWLDLTEREIPRAADPALLIRMASLLRHHEHPRAASAALREALVRTAGSNVAPIAARVARAAQELDPHLAHEAAWRALGCPELTLEERQNLEDLLAVVIPRLPGGDVALSEAWRREDGEPEAIDVETRIRVLDVVRATPVEIDGEGVHIATSAGVRKRVLFDRIDAVAVAAVEGLADKPVLVVDLVLNWRDARELRLRVIRMRGDKFDPRRIAPADSPLDSFRKIVSLVLDRAKAVPLPDRDSALGSPFASFQELALYERGVLMAEAPMCDGDDA